VLGKSLPLSTFRGFRTSLAFARPVCSGKLIAFPPLRARVAGVKKHLCNLTSLPPQAGSNSASGDKPANLNPQPASSAATGGISPELLAMFWAFTDLCNQVPLGPRTLRDGIKKGWIPSIRLPGGRRLLFDPPSVRAALLRLQTGNRA
jgi:hypothetical protein